MQTAIPCDVKPCDQPAYCSVRWGFTRSGKIHYGHLCRQHSGDLWERLKGRVALNTAHYTIGRPGEYVPLDQPTRAVVRREAMSQYGEPWEVTPHGIICDVDGRAIVDDDGFVWYCTRIVRCVNFCEGIPDEWLDDPAFLRVFTGMAARFKLFKSIPRDYDDVIRKAFPQKGGEPDGQIEEDRSGPPADETGEVRQA